MSCVFFEYVRSDIFLSGTSFAINPLELTTLQTIAEDGQTWTVCVNSIQPQLAVGSSDLDFLLGDIFMRNIYSVYVEFFFHFARWVSSSKGSNFPHSFNFGDISPSQNKKESPSIQLLSRTDQLQTFQSFVPTRKITLRSRAPLYDITRLTNQTREAGGLV